MPVMPTQLKSAVCAGPVGRVVVGVAGAGGGARPHLPRGAEDAVRHQAGRHI